MFGREKPLGVVPESENRDPDKLERNDEPHAGQEENIEGHEKFVREKIISAVNMLRSRYEYKPPQFFKEIFKPISPSRSNPEYDIYGDVDRNRLVSDLKEAGVIGLSSEMERLGISPEWVAELCREQINAIPREQLADEYRRAFDDLYERYKDINLAFLKEDSEKADFFATLFTSDPSEEKLEEYGLRDSYHLYWRQRDLAKLLRLGPDNIKETYYRKHVKGYKGG